MAVNYSFIRSKLNLCLDCILLHDFNPKLGDFGLAKLGPETGETHVTTRVMGTLGYAAPEYMATGRFPSYIMNKYIDGKEG